MIKLDDYLEAKFNMLDAQATAAKHSKKRPKDFKGKSLNIGDKVIYGDGQQIREGEVGEFIGSEGKVEVRMKNFQTHGRKVTTDRFANKVLKI